MHAAEIIDERVRRGSGDKAVRPEDKEYYVHYIDCAFARRPDDARARARAGSHRVSLTRTPPLVYFAQSTGG